MLLGSKGKRKERKSELFVLIHFLVSQLAWEHVTLPVVSRQSSSNLLCTPLLVKEPLTTRRFSKMAKWESDETDQPFLCLLLSMFGHAVLL